MRTYQMATVLNPSIVKQPFKVIEIPLRKFSDEVVPHHQNNYEQYKATINKVDSSITCSNDARSYLFGAVRKPEFLPPTTDALRLHIRRCNYQLISVSDAEQLKKETKDKKRTIKQLRDLMYELDTLRTQVEDEDLDKFDSKTLSLRKILINLVSGYSELEKAANKIEISQTEPSSKSMNENSHPFEEASQIQIFENIDELKLKEQQEQLSHVESIHRDVEDLHEMYQNLNGIIDKQGDDVENVARNVDEVQQNVESGTNHLRKAHKLTAVAYPVTGAFLGGIIGGPIGLVAGLKVGGIAALGCAIAGYTGGKWIKKKNENVECEMANEENTEESESDGTSHKKKI